MRLRNIDFNAFLIIAGCGKLIWPQKKWTAAGRRFEKNRNLLFACLVSLGSLLQQIQGNFVC